MNQLSNSSQWMKDADKAYHLHGVTSISSLNNDGPNIMKSANGIRITDIDGKEYIDAIAGLWCMTLGYGRTEFGDVAKEVMDEISFTHTFGNMSNEYTTTLAEKLVTMFNGSVAGATMSKVFFGTSGSDANDTNIKYMKLYNNLRGKPNKKKVIARTGAYHGLTWLTTAMTGIPAYHKAFDAPLDEVVRISTPSYYHFHNEGESEEDFTSRLITELKDTIASVGADNIGAFMAEPVMGTGGMFVPPAGYFEQVQPILKENDILFIADEVVTGFGRTGKMFGCETFGIVPDMVTLAKGLTSAYAPLSASMISEEIYNVLEAHSDTHGAVMHGFTYGGHPLNTAIALKAIEIIHAENIVDNVAEVGPYLRKKIREASEDCPYVGEVRGAGTMLGIEYVADKATRRWFKEGAGPHRVVATECGKAGLLSRALPYIDVSNMAPPLVMTKDDVDQIAMRFHTALGKAMPKLDELAKL